jgi:hypothetical protein
VKGLLKLPLGVRIRYAAIYNPYITKEGRYGVWPAI